jgi:CRP/FNR family transcriptional regulator
MTTAREILERFAFFRDTPASMQRDVLAHSELAHLAAGTYFYREGDRCLQVGLVGSGNLRVFKADDSAQEITLYHVQDQEACLVNMLSVFLDRAAMASAVAEAPTDAVVLPAAMFRHWLDTSNSLRQFVFDNMATRLVDVMVLVESVAFRKMDQRLAQLLLDRFRHEPQPPSIIARTHEELARELGTAREVVSRLIKEFERLGAVSVGRGRLELLDAKVLEGFVQGR